MDGEMYGFIRNDNGALGIANRIFEMRLYNYFLSVSELKDSPISREGANNRNRFIKGSRLDMEKLLSHYVTVFQDVYAASEQTFDENEGRRKFLLYIRPVINGTGNYYIEAQTRSNERMDVVIDYLGERFVVELKVWHGKARHENGERQLVRYLDALRLDKGYMLVYNFNRKKETGTSTVMLGNKILFEAMV